ncbi:MAG TPA: hypothetical protein ENL35_10460 [Chloroflexi bacterium]|nr:hypothetical protein [Chloroflexota bacterium]
MLKGWRLTAARILALLAVVAITVYIFTLRDEAARLQRYGYPGIFLLSILANATVILPAPGVALTFAFGAVLNPWGVALAAGAGAALGELTGYLAGFSGQSILRDGELYQRVQAWTNKHGGWAILALAAVPNPIFDLAGAAAGALGMPIPKFLLWVWAGKTIKMVIFALAGYASFDWMLDLIPGASSRP